MIHINGVQFTLSRKVRRRTTIISIHCWGLRKTCLTETVCSLKTVTCHRDSLNCDLPVEWINNEKIFLENPFSFFYIMEKKTVQNVVGIFKQPNTEHCQFLTWIQLKERRNVQEFEDQVCSLELPGTKKLNIIVILWSKFPERSLKIPSLISSTSDEYRYWVTSVRALQKHWNFLVVKHKAMGFDTLKCLSEVVIE